MSSSTALTCPIFEGHINHIIVNSHSPRVRIMDNIEFDSLFVIRETEAQKIKTSLFQPYKMFPIQSCDSNSNCPDSFIVKD